MTPRAAVASAARSRQGRWQAQRDIGAAVGLAVLLFIAPDAFFVSRRVQFATLAARDRVPTSCANREMVEAGLLMSYGVNIADMFLQVGIYTGNILKGTKPADLPVLQSTKFEFVINLQTAKTLGIEVPLPVQQLADEVIE